MALKSGRVGIHPSQVDPFTGMLLSSPGGASDLSDLDDVTLSDLENDQIIRYNSTTEKWENKNLPSGSVSDLSDLDDVAISSVSNDQILRYNSTSEKWENEDMPAIPAAQVNSDWNAVSGVAQILNKPTIPAAQVNSDWNAASGVAQILNKPSIPAAQVNSDWNAVSGVAQILNKPSIPTKVSDLTNGYVWTSGVSASAGATTATITNANITTNSTIEVFASVQGIPEPALTVSTGSCVLTFPALAQNTTFKLRITN